MFPQNVYNWRNGWKRDFIFMKPAYGHLRTIAVQNLLYFSKQATNIKGDKYGEFLNYIPPAGVVITMPISSHFVILGLHSM